MQLQFFDAIQIDDAAEADGDSIDYGLIQRRSLASEHLVATDILRRNWDCSFAAPALRYDLIADVGGLRRIQVKMCMRPKVYAGGSCLHYKFGAAPSVHRSGDTRLNKYGDSIELFAFVAFDRSLIIYMFPEKIETHVILLKAADFTAEKSDLSWLEALREWKLA